MHANHFNPNHAESLHTLSCINVYIMFVECATEFKHSHLWDHEFTAIL